MTSAHRPNDIRIFQKECRSLAAAGYRVTLIAPHDCDEVVDGIQIRAVPKPRGGRRERMLRTTRHVLQAAISERADLYHFHDPELIPAGIILKLRGRRVVYDAHENVPQDIRSKPYLPLPTRALIAGLAGGVEKLGKTVFDGIVAAIPEIEQRFRGPKAVTVRNYAIHSEFSSLNLDAVPRERAHLVFVGLISRIR